MKPARALTFATLAALGAVSGYTVGTTQLPGPDKVTHASMRTAPTATASPSAMPSTSPSPTVSVAPPPSDKDREEYADAVEGAEGALDAADASLDEAEGKVTDSGTVESLEQAAAAVQAALDGSPDADDEESADTSDTATADSYTEATDALEEATVTLTAAVALVEQSHDDWVAEQDRKKADQEAKASQSKAADAPSDQDEASAPKDVPASSELEVAAGTDANAAFCEGLSDARENQGLPRFEDCVTTDQQMLHAGNMAEAGEIWHTDGGENIVGYAVNVPQVMDAFMDSPPHRALILGETFTHAEVGCQWRDGSQDQWGYPYLFCSAKFI